MGMTVDIEVFHPAKPSAGSDPWRLLSTAIGVSRRLQRQLEDPGLACSRSFLIEGLNESQVGGLVEEAELDYLIFEDRLVDLIPQMIEQEREIFTGLDISPTASSLSCRQGIIFWNLLRLGRLEATQTTISNLSPRPDVAHMRSDYVVSILPLDYEELELKIVANTLNLESFSGRIHGIFLDPDMTDSDLQTSIDEVTNRIMLRRSVETRSDLKTMF